MPSNDLKADLAHPATTSLSISLAWGEMDALGHVNNVVYFRYIESARIDYIRKAGCHTLRDKTGIGFILQSVEMRFRQPLVFPDTIRVDTKLLDIESDRFTLAHAITSGKTGEVAAIGRGTIVTFDYARNVKSPLPEEFRRAIVQLETGPSKFA